jgi:hypothetical protein
VKLRAVPVVTPAHGELFANEWVEAALGSYDFLDAFAATGILVFPDDDLIVPQGLGSPQLRAARSRFIEIEDEILELTFMAVKAAVSQAFVAAANNILSRERITSSLGSVGKSRRSHVKT